MNINAKWLGDEFAVNFPQMSSPYYDEGYRYSHIMGVVAKQAVWTGAQKDFQVLSEEHTAPRTEIVEKASSGQMLVIRNYILCQLAAMLS